MQLRRLTHKLLRTPTGRRVRPHCIRLWNQLLAPAYFIHINKTAGTSIERALGLPFQHRTAREFLQQVGPERWRRRYSFAFVRNPWAKVASHYRYRLRTNQTGLANHPAPFTEWVRRAYGDRDPRYYDFPKMFMPQSAWLTNDHGDVLVDFIGRFETLHTDFATVARTLGRPAELPHLKKSSTPRTRYVDAYDPTARQIVAERFAPDLERFDYRFGD